MIYFKRGVAFSFFLFFCVMTWFETTYMYPKPTPVEFLSYISLAGFCLWKSRYETTPKIFKWLAAFVLSYSAFQMLGKFLKTLY